MSRRPGPRPTAVALAAVAIAALSACASGSDATTSSTRTTVDAVDGVTGTITLRHVYVAGPAAAGGSTPVIAALFNGGSAPDVLTGVSSPVASGGQPPPNATLEPGGANFYTRLGAAPTLTGLKRKLLVGQAVTVTFTFQKAAALTLDVPVEPLADESGAGATPTTLPSATLPAVTVTPSLATPTSSTGATPSGPATPSGSASPPAGATPTPTP